MNPIIETKLQELLVFAKTNGLMELAWQEERLRISFKRNPVLMKNSVQQELVVPAEKRDEEEVLVRSPMVGTFRRTTKKDHPPLIMEGNHVKPGDRLGIVECMKIPTDVVSYSLGKIKRILVQDGQAVEYGQPLFAVVEEQRGSINGAVNGNH